ncbi:MAG: reverse transcriptase-like protein, partial [Planctomycetes bacterium]|nr:reverse transcriptase-like protein [Planctomycetota bacterium]
MNNKAKLLKLYVHIDGGARGNPGEAGAGVVIRDADDNAVLFKGGYFLGETTNNVAEYQALLKALRLADKFGAQMVEIKS